MRCLRVFGMRRSPFISAIAILLGLVLVVGPARQGWALTLSEEKELGRKLIEKIREKMELVEDGEVITYVQSVGNRVAKQVGVTTYQHKFFVVNASIPNAFAIPGGYVFIFRGLIEMMESEGELASILSHELAHVQARHIQRRMEESRLLSIAAIAGVLAGAFLGSKVGGGGATPAIALGGLAGAQSVALKYSRDNETEADQLGFRYLCAAGYDPSDMVSVMRRMSQSQYMIGLKVPTYLSTHPALVERIGNLEDMAKREKASASYKKGFSPSQGDFSIMQAALVADYADTGRAAERFEAEIRKKDPDAYFGLGRLYLRQGRYSEALPLLQDAARYKPGSALVLSTLGSVYHREGKLAEAKRTLETALLLDSSASIAHYRLALVYQDLGQKENALEHLREVDDMAPVFPEIDHQMGIIYGQLNKVGLAHYHLGRYYEHKQDWKLTLYHYQKAKASLVGYPQKLEEINETIKDLEKKKKESILESHK